MPLVPTDEQFAALILETDPFKLAIRGHSAIEAELDAAIATLLHGDVPTELRDAPFRIKLAIARGLGLVLDEHVPLFTSLAWLRNRFAHGQITELPADRMRDLARHVVGVLEVEQEQARAALERLLADRLLTLRGAVISARAVIRAVAEARRREREEQQRILTVHRVLRERRAQLLAEIAARGEPQDAQE